MSNMASTTVSQPLKTPILLLIFNRPHTTRQVFQKIREVKPQKLFVAADGPRLYVPADEKNCAETRRIVGEIDWDCEVKYLFRKENLGCGKGVSAAINWFFEQVEEGIILEDDCLPDVSFFRFCGELLEKYRTDDRVKHISGHSLLNKPDGYTASYFFSHYCTIWGWATWKRAWKLYQFNLAIADIDQLKEKYLRQNNRSLNINALESYFRKSIKQKVDTWDYQWFYTVVNNMGLAAIPIQSLVENIGFDEFATHTKKRKKHLTVKSHSIGNSLIHPEKVEVDEDLNQKISGILFPGFFWKKFREVRDLVLALISSN